MQGGTLSEADRPLTNDDIDTMAARLNVRGYVGCYSDNTIPNLENNECCVINYQSAGQSGSHWCAIKRIGKTIYHFDSLAFPADQPIVDMADKNKFKVKTTYIRLQLDVSHYCGHYCILFLLCIQEPEDIPAFYNQFSITEDDVALKLNDKIMRDMAINW